ncbi:hypothetical protein M1271_02445 [Patescibacteria group bacterium]|nr:hypothetical protein [Patescibacteria group bacterium]MCL5797652.1 hypothetical protein [Patescibacteria group bacterium]
MKRTKKKKNVRKLRFLDRRILLGLGLVVLTGTIFVSSHFLNNPSGDIRTRASIEDDQKYCVNQPSCCNDIITQLNAKGDITDLPDGEQPYHACDWPIRGYCQMSICNQLPAGKKYRGECGWYWIFHDANGNSYHLGTNTPDGYGCMIGDTEASMRPKYGPDGSTIAPPTPTSLPLPTPLPTAIPTVVISPTSVPTQTPLATVMPTSIPTIVYPTNPSQVYPTTFVLPTVYVPPPTATLIPTPTSVPVIKIIGNNLGDFLQRTKESIIQFLTIVLP